MTDDIVKRLRSWDHCWPARWLEGATAEAADEIERLRADLDAYQKERDEEVVRLRAELAAERKLKTIYYDEWHDANKENGALREALKPFAQWCDEMELEGPILRDDARVASDITMADVRRARALLNNG